MLLRATQKTICFAAFFDRVTKQFAHEASDHGKRFSACFAASQLPIYYNAVYLSSADLIIGAADYS